MARKGNKANTVKKEELLENEAIRLSIFVKEDSDEVEVQYMSRGHCKEIAKQLISKFLEDEFNVVCLPKCGVIVCGGSMEEVEEFIATMKNNDNGNGEGDGKGEDNE